MRTRSHQSRRPGPSRPRRAVIGIALTIFALLAMQSAAAADSDTATAGGMQGTVYTDSSRFVEGNMTRILPGGGSWTMKIWQCNSSTRSGCTQFFSSGLRHLDGFGSYTGGKSGGVAGKYYYVSVYNSAGTLLLRTKAIRQP